MDLNEYEYKYEYEYVRMQMNNTNRYIHKIFFFNKHV